MAQLRVSGGRGKHAHDGEEADDAGTGPDRLATEDGSQQEGERESADDERCGHKAENIS
ncbi:hypothetical protein [Arthrobacter sp. UYCu712]|uniref:hypothetical protein n=1 Tax=Arthrobacter sp. UYCu712 TaxID=3156340 RepID=UPI00339A8708